MTQEISSQELNPLEPNERLASPSHVNNIERVVHPQDAIFAQDSAVAKAEKIERHGADDEFHDSATKRVKIDPSASQENGDDGVTKSERQKGVAPIKSEFLVYPPGSERDRSAAVHDDDAAEGAAHEPSAQDTRRQGKRKEKPQGQNTARKFGSSKDEVGLCSSRMTRPEFSPSECQFGERCKFEHDLRKYLRDWKRPDLDTFEGICPIWQAQGRCSAGWKCRFVGSHMEERETSDGRKELILIDNPNIENPIDVENNTIGVGTRNEISVQARTELMKRKFPTPKADEYNKWLDARAQNFEETGNHRTRRDDAALDNDDVDLDQDTKRAKEDNRARYISPPYLPSEKRRLYFGPETPILAPLTTQGNLPFRRLCVSLGAQLTYSEMAMSLPLIQGQKSELALLRAHESETKPPAYLPSSPSSDSSCYDNSQDLKFGAQIAATKPWQAIKTTEVLTTLCPSLRLIDMNCGCPIDLVYRAGAGSALLDSQTKLDKMIRGMNAVSGSVPITCKIRTGTSHTRPTALKLLSRLCYGNDDTAKIYGRAGGSGVAAVTLHGRSRQQRYTKSADWEYIADCAALIKEYNEQGDALADTIRDPDPRTLPNGGRIYFIGNGDCYSHTAYQDSLCSSGVDSIMLARGALIKPWVFEEIAQNQYLDKSASERLDYVKEFCKYGLECWGSDEMGVGTTRRFLLEWLSFTYRYVPVGILEHLPPSLQDRPPAWRGRNELETLLGSAHFKDWIKISEMFLGPAHKDFKFIPKHKSNSYEIEAEG